MGVPKSMSGAAAAVGGGVLVVGLTGAVLSAHGSNATTLTAATVAAVTPGQLPHATLNLSSYPDSMGGEHGSSGGAHPDWVSYGPSTNLHAPAHTLLTGHDQAVRLGRRDHQPLLRPRPRNHGRDDDGRWQDAQRH